MICIRLVLACALLIAAIATSSAAKEPPKLPPGVTCDLVRSKVAEHGRLVAYAWAKLNGYSNKDIAEARKCLRT
jgi:hypothetical protein